MCLDQPQLIILDEPTNHLDIDSREALVRAINVFDGAVILITHDPHLVETVADQLWLVRNGSVDMFDGDLDEYRQLLIEQRRAEQRSQRIDTSDPAHSDSARKERRRLSAENRAALAPLKRLVEQAEKQMEKLSAVIAKIEQDLANPALYVDNSQHRKISDLQIKLAEQRKKLEQTEEDWLAATTDYEEAMQASAS